MLVQECGSEECDGRVEVHGQLEAIDLRAGKKRKEAVDSRRLVYNLEVSDDLGPRPKRHLLEERLRAGQSCPF